MILVYVYGARLAALSRLTGTVKRSWPAVANTAISAIMTRSMRVGVRHAKNRDWSAERSEFASKATLIWTCCALCRLACVTLNDPRTTHWHTFVAEDACAVRRSVVNLTPVAQP